MPRSPIGAGPPDSLTVNDRLERAVAAEDDEEPHFPCEKCGEEHPVDVLEDGLCPVCVDDDFDESAR